MKTNNFCALMMLLAAAVFGFSSASNAGGGPSAPTLEGGPTYVGGAPSARLQGTPLPAPGTNTGALNTGGQSGVQGDTTGPVPGANSYGGGNNTGSATAGAGQRGVAGSSLPREKVSNVDPKTLSTSKTDGRFSSSLMDVGLKSSGEVKTAKQQGNKTTAEKETAKSQATTEKSSKTQSTSEGSR